MPQSFFVLSYIIINIDPVFYIGPLAIHWYGVAYVVGIMIGLWAILRYTKRLGLNPEIVYSVFWWAALAGLIGGRLYFVIQQPDLVSNYLEKPLNIIAVWNGGMAFFGAIFLGLATVAFVSWRRKLPIWLALDIATFFAAVGQIFGRFGNLVNGDIVGYPAGTLSVPPDTSHCALPASAPCLGSVSDPHVLPWATLYTNPHAFTQTSVPVHPAAAYEMLMNLILLAILIPLLLRLPRIKMGLVSLVYLVGYAITQFIVFFFRGSEPIVPFLGIDALKQAQWTAIFVLIAMIPYYYLIRRTSRAWTKEEAEAVNAFQAQKRLQPAAQTATAGDQAEAASHSAAHGASGQAASSEAVEESHQEHDHDWVREQMEGQGLVAEYNEPMAAELRTEGIEVAPAAAEEPAQTTTDNGTAPAKKPRTRASGTGERSSKRSGSSAKKGDA
jgi:phosphatidylglycerol:prolipoprotein diacylglycerol transferase